MYVGITSESEISFFLKDNTEPAMFWNISQFLEKNTLRNNIK